jgi:acetyltransferase-like isoleucine patch superfamily enzyme
VQSPNIVNVTRSILRNPLSLYLRFVLESARNLGRYQDFRQGYMSRVVNCEIEPHVRVYPKATVMNCKIGSFSYVADEAKIFGAQIGRFCSIGPNCRIGLGKHPTRGFVSTSPVFFSTARQCGSTFVDTDRFQESSPVRIENDVWIGANATILDGVRIANGAIIGAGAVVVSDVPDYSVFAGVPARILRFRFSEAEIALLTEFKWWEKDVEWIQQHHKAFQNIQQFMTMVGSQTEPDPDPSPEPIHLASQSVNGSC